MIKDMTGRTDRLPMAPATDDQGILTMARLLFGFQVSSTFWLLCTKVWCVLEVFSFRMLPPSVHLN